MSVSSLVMTYRLLWSVLAVTDIILRVCMVYVLTSGDIAENSIAKTGDLISASFLHSSTNN